MGSTHVITTGARIGTAVALLGLTACSGGNGASDDADTAAPMATSAGAATVPTTTVPGGMRLLEDGRAVAVAPGQPVVQTLGQAIAITAHTTVQTADVKAAVDRVTTTVTTRGGRVASADIDYASPTGPATARATLVVAIPPTELDAARATLADVGTVLSFEQQAEDVADQLTDLDTRIANQRASVARIRELYATATDVDAIVRIEADLTNRETALEQLLAGQAALKDRVAMSTLTIDITTTPPATSSDDGSTGLADALSGGWSAFAGAMFAIILVLTAAMPFVLTVLAITVVAWWVVRRTRKPAPVSQEAETEPALASRRE
jgi:hypothetical protein